MNAFMFRDKMYSFRKVNVGILIELCKLLDVGFVRLTQMLNEQDLEAMVALMYCSLRDKKGMTFEEYKEMSTDEYIMMTELYTEVSK